MAIVEGISMEPTLAAGDRLLVKHGAVPGVGELGVVRLPDGTVAVKRLSLIDDGYWFARDNPREGTDSWTWNRPATEEDVIARVVWRLWPRPRQL